MQQQVNKTTTINNNQASLNQIQINNTKATTQPSNIQQSLNKQTTNQT